MAMSILDEARCNLCTHKKKKKKHRGQEVAMTTGRETTKAEGKLEKAAYVHTLTKYQLHKNGFKTISCSLVIPQHASLTPH